jgi:hypothetical protein
MLTNDQIFNALDSISDALEVVNTESFMAHKFVNRFEKDVMRGECYLQGFRLNMIERLRVLEGMIQCASTLIKDVMNTEEKQANEDEVKQCEVS